jgi:hypothetical protein
VTLMERAIEEDRFPRAPRLDPLRSALAKLDPAAAASLRRPLSPKNAKPSIRKPTPPQRRPTGLLRPSTPWPTRPSLKLKAGYGLAVKFRRTTADPISVARMRALGAVTEGYGERPGDNWGGVSRGAPLAHALFQWRGVELLRLSVVRATSESA